MDDAMTQIGVDVTHHGAYCLFTGADQTPGSGDQFMFEKCFLLTPTNAIPVRKGCLPRIAAGVFVSVCNKIGYVTGRDQKSINSWLVEFYCSDKAPVIYTYPRHMLTVVGK